MNSIYSAQLQRNNLSLLKKCTVDFKKENLEFNFEEIINKYGLIFAKNLINTDIIKILDEKISSEIKNDKSKFKVPSSNGPITTKNFFPDFIDNNLLLNYFTDINNKIGKNLLKYYNSCFFTCKNALTSIHETTPNSNPLVNFNYHQDNGSFFWKGTTKALTFWTPFVKTGENNAPGLRLIAKKFNKNVLLQNDNSFNSLNYVNKNFLDEIVFPQTDIGDCIIFDEYTLHGTALTANQKNIRRSLDFRFLPKNSTISLNDDEITFLYPFIKEKKYKVINNLFERFIIKIKKKIKNYN